MTDYLTSVFCLDSHVNETFSFGKNKKHNILILITATRDWYVLGVTNRYRLSTNPNPPLLWPSTFPIILGISSHEKKMLPPHLQLLKNVYTDDQLHDFFRQTLLKTNGLLFLFCAIKQSTDLKKVICSKV